MRFLASLLVAVLAHSPVESLVCQEPTALQSDARVRFMMTGGDQWTIGNLLGPPRDSVRLLGDPGRDTLAVATASLARFEVSKGRHRQAGRGATIGALVGVVAGAALGLATYEECSGFCPAPDPGRGGSAMIGGILFGLLGAGVGAITGSQIKAERWAPLPQPWGTVSP